MNDDLEKKLFDEYPLIFADKDKPITESLMCDGFACGDGWYNIINTLCLCIQSYVNYNDCEQVVAEQVKEKFGGLRFYINGGNNTVYELISFAEIMSSVTCENCGAPGKERGGSWIKTLCDNCANNKSK